MSEITKDQQTFIDLTLEFTKLIYEQCEKNINPIYDLQIKNRDTLLDKIARILLSYNISDNILDLNSVEKKRIFLDLSNSINSIIKDELEFEARTVREILKQAILDKFNTDNYVYSLGIDFTLTQLPEKELDKIINAKIQGENWSKRIWNNKDEISKDLRKQVKDFLNGKTNVNQIEKVIKTKYNVNATNATRLINTEICRVQEESNEVWAEKHDIQYQMFLATLDSKTSNICREHDGKVYPVDDVNKPIPPLHPNCRSVLVNIVNKDWKPTQRYDNDVKKNINWQSYNEWKKNYIDNNPERLANYNMIKNKSSDKRQYQEYKKILGNNIPKTLEDFQKLKYNNSDDWELLKDYTKSRSNNMISAFNSFEDYKKYKNIIKDEIVGLTTSNGIKITGQSKHFIERVLGTTEDPHTGRPRSGVEITHIKDAIQNGNIRTRKNDPDSIKFVTEKCIVSINPNTGLLIQVNPQ